MFSSNPLLLLSPLRDEIAPLLGEMEVHHQEKNYHSGLLWNRPAVISWTGVGKKRVREFFRSLPSQNFQGIVFLGCAGALKEGIQSGEIRLCQPEYFRVGEEIKSQLPPYCRRWEQRVEGKVSIEKGASLTTRTIINTPEEKKHLGSQCGAQVVEMENYHVADFWAGREVPLLFLRVVLDPLDQALPDFGDLSQRDGPSPLNIARNLLFHPLQMAYLARTFPRCARALVDKLKEIWPYLSEE